LISNILAEEKRKRQRTQRHNPVLLFLEAHSQESRAPNPEAVLRKFPRYLPSSKIFLNHCQFKAVPNPSIQCWGLEPSQFEVWVLSRLTVFTRDWI